MTLPTASTFALALACAALFGFAAHRASLCNVRAVAEILSNGTAHMLGSLMQAALWMALLLGSLSVLWGYPLTEVRLVAPAAWPLFGGWLFGVGAALNGGCSLSTLHRLADGELGMLATLCGFALGVLFWIPAGAVAGMAGGPLGPVETQFVTHIWTQWPRLSPWLLAALAGWALLQAVALRRLAHASVPTSMMQRVLAPRYHLAVAAAMLGLAGGFLYATQGAWSYTSHLRSSILHAWGSSDAPAASHSVLVLALVFGMVASAVQRGSVTWRWPRRAATWLRHVGGGALMGAGAAMVPGGNDTLLLNVLPTLALQAIGAYVAMLGGITMVLQLMQRMHMPMPSTRCTKAGCTKVRSPNGR